MEHRDLINIRGEYYTTDPNTMQKYLDMGYWVIPEPYVDEEMGQYLNILDKDGWEICLDWPQDPKNPPEDGAIHK